MRIALLSALSAVVLTAAASSSRGQTTALSCYGTQQSKQVAELLFGRDIGDKLGVSETAWAHFLAREITPRFPDGLTVTDAIGQWRDPTAGTTVREPSKRVEIVLPGNADDEARLDAIVKTYEYEFRQHSVGIIVRQACVSF